MEIIYVQLLNEGTSVWKAMSAEKIKKNIYRIISTDSFNSNDEELEFKINETVCCERQKKSGEWVLVAIKRN